MQSRTAFLVAIAAANIAACSGARYGIADKQAPGITVPAPIAEGKRGPDEPRPGARAPVAILDAGADSSDGAAEPVKVSALPDPEPLRLAKQWQYDVLYDHGRLRISAVKSLVFPQPIVTARQMGRYAIELWIGRELVERVRFDFPLLAAEEPPSPKRQPIARGPSLSAATVVTRRVLVPASPRATRAILLDRATGQTEELAWPPDAPLDRAGHTGEAFGHADAGLSGRGVKGSAPGSLHATLGPR